jgi:dihydropteroate synthase
LQAAITCLYSDAVFSCVMISARQNTGFSTNKTLNLNGRLLDLHTPVVMGILNVTPDSFYDRGQYTNESNLLRHVEKMIAEGAAIIDVGGYSSRPGASDISVDEELKRVIDAIKAIKKHFAGTVISVDTFRSTVAKASVGEGAEVINDISGGELDDKMFSVVAALKVPYICMHMKGTPQTMNSFVSYDNMLHEIVGYFHPKLAALHRLGVKDIILDPGFGFAKTADQSFQLLNNLDHLKILEKPLLVGLSRKSMIWKTLNIQPELALNGTIALNMVALMKGVSILRVHDVREAVECITLYKSIHS